MAKSNNLRSWALKG